MPLVINENSSVLNTKLITRRSWLELGGGMFTNSGSLLTDFGLGSQLSVVWCGVGGGKSM